LTENRVSYWNVVPEPDRHVYFEFNPLGYLRRGLALTGATVLETECVKGYSRGDAEVHYRFVVQEGPPPDSRR
jgi:hypothetical protein